MASQQPFTKELAVFEKHKKEFLEKFPGLFVLIKNNEIIGPLPSAEAAYAEGLQKFGLSPFLVKQVLEDEPVGFAPALIATARPNAGL
jgi:hypothetical protein